MTRLRVLLADDQRMFLAGLQKLIEDEFNVVGAVEDGREPTGAADQFDPDLIVADICMPSLNGIDAARRLKEAGSKAKLISLCAATAK
jgi:YesN/AraC family two-component response regulator